MVMNVMVTQALISPSEIPSVGLPWPAAVDTFVHDTYIVVEWPGWVVLALAASACGALVFALISRRKD
jgi:hypothetical protein